MKLFVEVHIHPAADVGSNQQQQIGNILTRIIKMDRTLDEVMDVVRSRTTKQDSIIALLGGIKTKLEEALANQGKMDPETQAKLNELFDLESGDAQEIDEAITSNTPQEPQNPAPGTVNPV
jgi:hypothetical protein